ncbi:MAG: Zn-ribbon domain-containing OB-fold protein [Candidatus Thermoplasmatota archaeon]|jgi:uncharacterized OB-fold protein|nr:Zn-ribbon domain-containing OB-fold protein [Candidatus Thermoplasmatota archaeon]MCL5962794.1 Zn-ribbon domain-containing OB-fold protein [Candidatus Thermoplasmatota archaeon]
MSVSRYWREAKSRYMLQGSKCGRCNRLFFPKRSVCPSCKSLSINNIDNFNLSGNGVIDAFTYVHEGLTGFEMQIPYVIAMIKLEEGISITAQVVDIDDNTKVYIGMPVRMVFRKIGEDGKSGMIYYGYKFSPDMANFG